MEPGPENDTWSWLKLLFKENQENSEDLGLNRIESTVEFGFGESKWKQVLHPGTIKVYYIDF